MAISLNQMKACVNWFVKNTVQPLTAFIMILKMKTNAGNKHYEYAFFSSILSDADIEKYYSTMKKVYARKGIVIN